MIDLDRWLESLSGRHARHYTSAVHDMVVAMARGNRYGVVDARTKLERVITDTMAMAEIVGASMALRSAAAVFAGGQFRKVDDAAHCLRFSTSTTQDILPRVTFDEAVQDMIDRTPVTIRDAAQRTARRISQIYSEGHMVAFVRSAEQAVTERVRDLIAAAIRDGTEEIGVGRMIRTSVEKIRTATAAWSEGYSRMAFRTNLNTAVTAGRFRQAQDPDIKAVMPCFQFHAVGDDDTRDNHRLMDGRIFLVDNPVWNKLAPPLGYNCRCRVVSMSRPMLDRMGRVGADGSILEDRVPAGALADPGFRHGGRPDLLLASAAQ